MLLHRTVHVRGANVVALAAARVGGDADEYAEDPYAFAFPLANGEGGFVACLCDGAGDWGDGVAASRVAARQIADRCANTLSSSNANEAVVQSLTLGNETVRAFSAAKKANDDEFGATCSAAVVLIDDGRSIHVGWVGGVEVMLIRRGARIDRTEGHRLWRDLVTSGALASSDIAAFPHKNVVTRGLGGDRDPKNLCVDIAVPHSGPGSGAVSVSSWAAEDGDVIVMCSRKVDELLTEAEVLALVDSSDLTKTVSDLLETSLARGPHFEVCAIAIRVSQSPV